MKQNRPLIVFLVVTLSATVFQFAAQAEVYRFYFDVVTTNFPDVNQRQINANIMVNDTKFRPPDAIRSLSVTAPDGTVFSYNPTDPVAASRLFWDETYDQFWFAAKASDFQGEEIPSGKYTAKIKDKTGNVLTESEIFNVKFSLECPTITSPSAGSTVDSLTPTITWSNVKGAKVYRVFLTNQDWNQPIYPTFMHALLVYRNWVTIPSGVLLPQTNYLIRIEARDGEMTYNERGRSNWISFRTP